MFSNTSVSTQTGTTVDTFLEQVKTCTTFKVATFLTTYWFPVLVPVGLVGNALSFLVMIKPNNRKLSTCIYMAGISVNDNMMMFLGLHNWLVSAMKVHEFKPLECTFSSYAVLLCLQNSTFLVLAMTSDKYIAIKWPHRAAIYSTSRRAAMTVIGVYTAVIIYNIPHVFMSKLKGDVCVAYSDGGAITKFYSWLSFVVNAIIPFTLLLYMNYVIIKKVQNSGKMFGNIESNEQSVVYKRQSDSSASQKRQRAMKNTENQLTIMLLLVTTLFLIWMIPTYIRFLYTTFVGTETPVKYANMMFFYHVSHKLYFTNNGINFFLYCISGQKFRDDLKELLCDSNVASKMSKDTNSTEISSI